MEKMHGHISDALILDILHRLPTKSVVRFKCVCKSWLSSITQLKHHNYKDEFILYSILDSFLIDLDPQASDIEGVFLRVPRRNLGYRFITIGSCNGLLCFYTEETMGFVICNPWTRKYKTVPSHIKISFEEDILFGFGYDHSTDDYMIVRIFHLMVEIYSRKTDSWLQMGILTEEIKLFSVDSGLYKLQIGFFANGALYWHVQYIANMEYYERGGVSDDAADDGILNTILCFDLVDRKFSMIVPPVDDEVCKKPVFDLCVFGGNLCMVYYDHNCHTDVWSWEGNNKGNWIKLMSIPCLMSSPYLTPVFLMNNGQLLLKTIMKEEYMTPFADSYFKTKLFFYDQEQKTFRELDIGSRKVISYTKSLVSPAHDAGDDHESSIYCPEDLSGVDIAAQGMFELQQHSTSRVGDIYKQEVKPEICRHLSSEFGAHCKSSTSRVSLQWSIKLD